MKIYICADIEGIAGLSSREQLGPQGGAEYARAREQMTAEVAAAAEACLAAGADAVIISDSHGNAQNLLLEKLPRQVQLVRAWPRPLGMMQGVEEPGIDGCFFVGHHAGAAHVNGICAHTHSSKIFVDVRLNGRPCSETLMNAAVAGHFGVPTLLATGDDVYTSHASELFGGGCDTVTTKWAYGNHAARMRHPALVLEEIRTAAGRAVARAGNVPPFRLPPPYVLDLTFQSRMAAELLAYLPICERLSANTVRYVAPDLVALSKWVHFVQAYPQAFA